MSLNASKLGKDIVKKLLGKREISKEDRETMEKSWIKICDVIVKHIQDNGEVLVDAQVELPVNSYVNGTSTPLVVEGVTYSFYGSGNLEAKGNIK